MQATPGSSRPSASSSAQTSGASASRPGTTLGRIGFEGRYDYGALGPVTNLASRLSSQAAAGQILIGPRAYAAVEERVETAPAGELELKGFARPVTAYEVRGLREPAGSPNVN